MKFLWTYQNFIKAYLRIGSVVCGLSKEKKKKKNETVSLEFKCTKWEVFMCQ